MKTTTIRDDQALNNLAHLCGKTKESLIKHIEGRVEAEISDFWELTEFAGHSLWSAIMDCTNHDSNVSCLYVLGKCTPDIEKWFIELKVWGVDNDCPECGCESKAIEYETEGDDINEPIHITEIYRSKCMNPGCEVEF